MWICMVYPETLHNTHKEIMQGPQVPPSAEIEPRGLGGKAIPVINSDKYRVGVGYSLTLAGTS